MNAGVYIIQNARWWWGKDGRWEKIKNEDSEGKNEKGERTKEDNCIKNGVKGLNLFGLYTLKE